MWVNDLVADNKISLFEAQIYELYSTQLGTTVLERLKHETFMATPEGEDAYHVVIYGIYEGQRAHIRFIINILDKVNSLKGE